MGVTCSSRVVPSASLPLLLSHVSCYVTCGRKDALFMVNIYSNDVRSSHSTDKNIIKLPAKCFPLTNKITILKIKFNAFIQLSYRWLCIILSKSVREHRNARLTNRSLQIVRLGSVYTVALIDLVSALCDVLTCIEEWSPGVGGDLTLRSSGSWPGAVDEIHLQTDHASLALPPPEIATIIVAKR